jgi:hypothetical protein
MAHIRLDESRPALLIARVVIRHLPDGGLTTLGLCSYFVFAYTDESNETSTQHQSNGPIPAVIIY